MKNNPHPYEIQLRGGYDILKRVSRIASEFLPSANITDLVLRHSENIVSIHTSNYSLHHKFIRWAQVYKMNIVSTTEYVKDIKHAH